MSHVRRTQVQRSEQTRKQLIEAAIAVVMEQGLGAATVLEICRRAEVTTGALQHHFGSKSELMATVVSELFTPFTREIEPTPAPQQTPLDERIERLVQRYWKIYGDPRYFAVIEILCAIRHDRVLSETVKVFRAGQVTVLEDFLPREFPEVRMTPHEMRMVVHHVLDLMRGFAIRTLFENGPGFVTDLLDECRHIIREEFEAAVPGGQGA